MFACAAGGDGGGVEESDLTEAAAPTSSGSGGATGGPCVGPLGEASEPDAYPPCGDGAHCLPSVASWPALAAFVGPRDSGGYCVPDVLIASGGIFTPKSCASIGGADGACLPTVYPEIASNEAFIPQDVCASDERCVPCVSPLDQTVTGACELAFECPIKPGKTPGSSETTSGGAGSGDDPATCEYDGAPVIDTSKRAPCPKSVCSAGGHCVPSAQVPPEMAGQLQACDGTSYCVPDPFLVAGGDKVPVKACKSIGGNEGRCMSMCLAEVGKEGASLPQGPSAGCGEAEACLPCFDPITGDATGACTSLPCDAGPTSPPKTFPKCCGGIGTCIPLEQIPPEHWSKLGSDVCGPLARCTPDAFMPNHVKSNPYDETNEPCETDWLLWGLLGDTYKPGVCLPTCIPEVGDSLLGQGSCNGGGFVCTPCMNPLDGKPSGACN